MHRSWLSNLRPLPWCLAFAPLLLLFLACFPASPPDGAASAPQTGEADSTVQPVSLSSSRDPDQLFPPCNRYDNVQDLGSLPPLGETTERAFTESYEAHRYTLDVEAGDYIHVVVEQQNVDLVVSLLDETGKGLLRVDSLYGQRGLEETHWHSQESAHLQLLVCSGRDIPKEAGYSLNLAMQRNAGEVDAQYVDAFLDYHSAEAQRRRGTDESRHEALQLFHRAAEQWRITGHQHDKARAIYGISRLHTNLRDDYGLAIEFSTQAADLLQVQGDSILESATRHRLGSIFEILGDNREAIRQYKMALGIRQEIGHHSGQLRTARNLANAYRVEGKFREARDLLENSLQLAQELGSSDLLADLLQEFGKYYRTLADHEQALVHLQQVLEIQESSGDQEGLARIHFTIGDTLLSQNRFQESIPHLEKALTYYQANGPKNSEASTLLAMGICYTELEDYSRARKLFDSSLAIATKEQHTESIARSHLNIGWVKAETGECREAIQDFHLAAELFGSTNQVEDQAISIHNISSCHLWLDEHEEAIRFGYQAIELSESIRANALTMSWQAKFFSKRRYYFDSLIDTLQQVSDEKKSHHLEAAIQISERSKARSLLDAISSADESSTYPVSEKTQARALEGRIARLKSAINQRLSHQLLISESEDLSSRLDPEARHLLEQLEIATRHQSDLNRARKVAEPKTLNISEIRAELGKDTTLLKFHIGYWKSHLWLIDSDRILHFELPSRTKIESLTQAVYRNLSTKARPVQTQMLLENLSQTLFEKVIHEIRSQRVLLVSDGPLHYLPLDALPLPPKYVEHREPDTDLPSRRIGDLFEFIGTPSVSVLAALRKRSKSSPSIRDEIGIIADPIFHLEDPRLRGTSMVTGTTDSSMENPQIFGHLDRLVHSSVEANAISEIAEQSRWVPVVATGFNATKDYLLANDLDRFKILHFATHADFHSQQPEFSHLAFSQFDENGQVIPEGNLFAYELYDLRLNADLIVLSACSSALGSEINGEGLVGLTQGFFQAGARQILVSLWKVDDRATAEMMRHFYENLLLNGLEPVSALWEAKMTIRRQPQWRAPYFWAGFALQGDWMSR